MELRAQDRRLVEDVEDVEDVEGLEGLEGLEVVAGRLRAPPGTRLPPHRRLGEQIRDSA